MVAVASAPPPLTSHTIESARPVGLSGLLQLREPFLAPNSSLHLTKDPHALHRPRGKQSSQNCVCVLMNEAGFCLSEKQCSVQ